MRNIERRADLMTAGLLSDWTDSDTAMEAVGTSLGIFGERIPSPNVVLSSESPLRNALFDVLLNLVEGGALEMRPCGDGRYAFRWRADIAVAALAPDGVTIDLTAPAPHLAELTRAENERDDALRREADALRRADFAERVASEYERLLLSAGPPAAGGTEPEPPVEMKTVEVETVEAETIEVQTIELETVDFEAIEVETIDLVATPPAPAKVPAKPRRKRAKKAAHPPLEPVLEEGGVA